MSIWGFAQGFLDVECRACRGHALASSKAITCLECKASHPVKEFASGVTGNNPPAFILVNSYGHGRRTEHRVATETVGEWKLWYSKRMGKGYVWAYNLPHLKYYLEFIESDLRERQKFQREYSKVAFRQDPPVWASWSFASRLPAWIKSAKNRETIAAALRALLKK